MLEFIIFLFMMLPITLVGFIMLFVFWKEISDKDFVLYSLLSCYLMLMVGVLIFVVSAIVNWKF